MSLGYLRATVESGFWKRFRDLVRQEVIPYQWNALNDRIPGAPPSHAVENYRIAAGRSTGSYEGLVFQDSDLSKWLEAAGHLLADEADAGEIRGWVEQTVALIAEAQTPDGYLNTYFTVKEPGRRWKNLREAHELYCAGHLIEAGVAVCRATKSEKMLRVVTRLADHIDATFGATAGKKRGYPGHEEIELALVKLYRFTGERRYLELAKYFIDERGRKPNYFEEEAKAPDYKEIWGLRDLGYFQAHVPANEQADADGHAVRAMYLYAAMADVALETGDAELERACIRLWESATQRRMYVTGGVGSAAHQERFTLDYDLPGDTAYAETCAAIGLVFFSYRMARLRNEGRFGDVMERALYNGVLSGLALDGRSYFYVNPLEVNPEVCDKNPTYAHVKYRRQPWYGCACCPPNIARTIASIGEYAYHVSGGTLYADLYHGGTITLSLGGVEVAFRQTTDYPWDGRIAFDYLGSTPARFTLALRIPGWSRRPALTVGGNAIAVESVLRSGFAHIEREWRSGDRVELVLPMEPVRVYAHPRVRAAWGKVAVQRGPVVYCLEEEDNGPCLHTARLPREVELVAERREGFLGGVVTVSARGSVWGGRAGTNGLYVADPEAQHPEDSELLFIPYYTWANRNSGEMTVWIRE